MTDSKKWTCGEIAKAFAFVPEKLSVGEAVDYCKKRISDLTINLAYEHLVIWYAWQDDQRGFND